QSRDLLVQGVGVGHVPFVKLEVHRQRPVGDAVQATQIECLWFVNNVIAHNRSLPPGNETSQLQKLIWNVMCMSLRRGDYYSILTLLSAYRPRCKSSATMTIKLRMMTMPPGISLKPFDSATLPNRPSNSSATINDIHQPVE